jgi:hypothetical protein
MDDAIAQINTLVEDSTKVQIPLRTTKELIDFYKSPPKRGHSVPLEEAMTSIVKMFGLAEEAVILDRLYPFRILEPTPIFQQRFPCR